MKNIITDIPDLEGEVWAEIKGYDEAYWVSNLGRIKSYKYKTPYLLVQTPNTSGYMRVQLSKDGKRQRPLVHRLVATYFVPNDDPLRKNTVDHIDTNKSRNTYDNLQWLSLSDNIKQYYKIKKEQTSAENHSQK